MKKGIAFLAALCIMSCGTVFAEDIINLKCDSENKTISIEVQPKAVGNDIDCSTVDEILLYVVSETGTLDDKTSEIISFEKIKNKDNKFAADIQIRQNVSSGWYKAFINDFMQSDYMEVIPQSKRTKRFYVFSNAEISQLKKDFSSSNAADMVSCISNYSEKLGFDDEAADDNLAKIFVKIRKTEYNDNFGDFAGIYSVYEKSSAVNKLYSSENIKAAEEAMNGLQKVINIEADEYYEKYKEDILSIMIKNKKEMLQDADILSSLNKYIGKCIAVAVINNASRTEMDTVLKKYAGVLGINLNGDYKKVNAVEAAKALTDKNFGNADEVKAAFDKRVSELVSALNRTASGGGGGGGNTFLPAVKPETDRKDNQDNSDTKETEINFPDVKPDSSAREAILYLAQKGIIKGDDRGNFNPSLMITREEFVALLVRMLKLSGGEDCGFSDVDSDSWYYSEICAAKKAGIINGVEDDIFGVGLNIVRQDMVTIVYRLKNDWETENNAKEYYDSQNISDYAKKAVEVMRSIGAIDETGNNRFLPKECVTREEVAMFLYNTDKFFGGK